MEKSLLGVSTRLRQLMALENMTIKEFSEALGTPKGTLEKYLNSPRLPGPEFLQALNSQLGVSATWVLNGIGPRLLTSAFSAPTDGAGFIEVPRYDVQASAGGGAVVDNEETVSTYSFSKAWLERRNLSPDALSIIEVKGDSMEPDLRNKDLILLNHQVETLEDSNIYAVRYSDRVFVKRVQQLPNGAIQLLSSNKNYTPIEIALGQAGDLGIVGRVVASMHEW